MPRMPTEDDLSTSMPGSRRVVQQGRDFIGPAVQRFGETVEQEGLANRDQDTRFNRRAQAERDSLDLSRARADWQTRRANEASVYEYTNDQEYKTWGKRFGEHIYKHRDSSTALIANPKIRRKFEAETDADIAESTRDITGRATKIDTGKRKAEGMASVDQMMNVAATLPRDQADKVLAEARKNIDNMAFSGVLLPEEAVNARTNTVERFASIKAGQDVQDNPEQADRWLRGDAESGTAGLIKSFEGFRSTPYFDKNALRTGYGSDTITLADGRVIKVTKGMRVSRQDAERDLNRRIGDFQDGIIKQVGVDAWANLSPSAQAGLTSFVYNYGSLTNDVAAAVKSGDMSAIATAVRARGGDNDGINAGRRDKEAQVIEGRAGNQFAQMATPDYYEFLPAAQRVQLQSQAEAEIARRDKERNDADDLDRFAMRQTVEDDVKQIANTGVATNIDPHAVVTTLGATAAAGWLDKRQTAAETYAETSKLDNMTDNEISEHLDMLEPKAGTANFDRAQTVYDAVERKAKKLTDLRLKDPALSVEDSVIVKKAEESYDPENPASIQTMVRARYAAQDAVGIPDAMRQPITRAEARKIIAPIQSTIDLMDASIVAAIGENGSNSAGRRAAVKAVRGEAEATVRQTVDQIEKTYGEYAPRVLAFAIAESVRDKEIGDIATQVLRKIAKGEKATLMDMNNLESVTETSIADKSMDGKLPAPKASAPPEGGQQAPKSTGQQRIDQMRAKSQQFPPPTQKAVEYLMANPDTAAQFDRAYGAGSAQRWLPKGQ